MKMLLGFTIGAILGLCTVHVLVYIALIASIIINFIK